MVELLEAPRINTPFRPLPDDCFDYYPVEPKLAQLRLGLRQQFHSTARQYWQRQRAAYEACLPTCAGIMKAEYRESFAAERAQNTNEIRLGKSIPRLSIETDDLHKLSAQLVDSTECPTPQPMLHKVIHSSLNYIRQTFGVMRSDTARIATNNRDINPDKLLVPYWHPEDDNVYADRAPTLRLFLRTSCQPIFKDAHDKVMEPQPFELIIATGDILHKSRKPERPMPSKLIQLAIFPIDYLTLYQQSPSH